MLHRDYIEEMIEDFCQKVTDPLEEVIVDRDPAKLQVAEAAVAGFINMTPEHALCLNPASFVTMMRLTGIGSALAEYAAFTLYKVSQVYEAMGDENLAQLRREQALGLAEAYQVDPLKAPRGMEGCSLEP